MITTTAEKPRIDKPRRPWNTHAFYMSDQMMRAARAIARHEQERTGRQTGAGQIIDRAMQRYVADLYAPDELAALLNGRQD